ncbi:MAG: translation initiation factor IF-3 [Gammaproteobacteria bacterium]|nr:translation initiation factor IF-3 [Gammaproteobacteria bacterium]
MAVDKKTRLNEEITSPEIRLIAKDGEQVGVVTIQDALTMADEVELDLVEIVPTAEPPVCRIMNYGKFVFEQTKKKQASKKKQKQIQVKEIKIRPSTEEGDYQIKLRNLIKFLNQGDKVKITLRFRGREMAHQELGAKMLKRIEADLDEYGNIEQFPKMEGRQLIMVMGPKK